MSCSLYRWTEECDWQPCPGDCDVCDRNMEEITDEGEPGDYEYD